MSAGARTMVLIGATSGLGREAARRLAADGHRMILVGRSSRRAKDLAAELPQAHVISADIAVAGGVDAVARQVAEVTDRVDVPISNAGVMRPAREVTAEGFELNFAVHHLGHCQVESGPLGVT